MVNRLVARAPRDTLVFRTSRSMRSASWHRLPEKDTIRGTMRNKHRRILERMRARPTPANIRWADIVAMLQAGGVQVSERAGSRVLLKRGSERMIVHRPHPAPETGRGTVRAIVAFLDAAGIDP